MDVLAHILLRNLWTKLFHCFQTIDMLKKITHGAIGQGFQLGRGIKITFVLEEFAEPGSLSHKSVAFKKTVLGPSGTKDVNRPDEFICE